VTLVLTHTGPAKPRPAPRPLPIDDGSEVSREAIKPGNYATAINIHNPSLGAEPVTIYKRAVLAPGEGEDTQSPSKFLNYSLSPGHAVEVDCYDIEQRMLNLGPTFATTPDNFIKGFVTILSRDQLDVVGVYTAEPPRVLSTPASIPGIALEMLPIAPRFEFVPGGAATVPTGARFYEYSAKFLCGQAVPPA
jgi:hypothetical protein